MAAERETHGQLIRQLTDWRRDLHRIPEVDFDLPQTLAYVEGVLRGIEHDSAAGRAGKVRVFSPCRSSLCIFFDKETETARAIRTDMDALPVCEQTGASFASTHPGKMHACGHDGHMAMALGIASWLGEHLDEVASSVLVVFQPAEETTGGAHVICKSGVFEEYHVECIFGFHLWPDLPFGQVASRPGALLAASNETTVTFAGRASHIAKAEQGADALAAAAAFVGSAYELLDKLRAERGGEPALLKFGRLEAGEVRNQIASSARVEGSLRTFSLEMRSTAQESFRELASRCAAKEGCTAETHYSEGYPPVVNDETLYAQAASALPELELLPEPLLIAEDFAWYQQYLPGVFLLLGTGTGIPLHASTFDFDESLLAAGVDVYRRLLVRR